MTEDLESAYAVSKRIAPVTQDLLPALEYISNFIRPISNDIVTRLQNVPERDFGGSFRSQRSNVFNQTGDTNKA